MDRQVSKTMENYCLIYLYTSSSADSSFPHQPALHPFALPKPGGEEGGGGLSISLSLYISRGKAMAENEGVCSDAD